MRSINSTCDDWNTIYHNWISKSYGMGKYKDLTSLERILLMVELNNLNNKKCLVI